MWSYRSICSRPHHHHTGVRSCSQSIQRSQAAVSPCASLLMGLHRAQTVRCGPSSCPASPWGALRGPAGGASIAGERHWAPSQNRTEMRARGRDTGHGTNDARKLWRCGSVGWSYDVNLGAQGEGGHCNLVADLKYSTYLRASSSPERVLAKLPVQPTAEAAGITSTSADVGGGSSNPARLQNCLCGCAK